MYTPTEYVLYKEQCTLYVVTHSYCVNEYILILNCNSMLLYN